MRQRINSRAENLAKVSIEKAEADSSATNGIYSFFSYFDKKDRKECKIKIDNLGRWVFDLNNNAIKNKQYMYAVGPNGALYVGNITVHSQFKAGKETQSAGWVNYFWDEEKQKISINIDNCSGHYTPTLSQFISTLYGLCEAQLLPKIFEINISKFTNFDYQNFDKSFWKNAIKNSLNGEKSLPIVVDYQEEKGFIFALQEKKISMSMEEIKENETKSNNAKALK